MKSLKIILVLITVHCSLFTIHCAAQYPARYFIKFTDKNNDGYSLGNPSAFLSARSIARRTHQNIGYDSLDLPVTQAYIDSLAAHGATILHPSKWLNGVTIETTDTAVLNDILALPFVVNSTAVGKIFNPNGGNQNNGFLKQESMLSTNNQHAANRGRSEKSLDYGYGLAQIQLIHGDYLHNLGFLGDGMVIAMIDAGFLNADILTVFDSARNNNQFLGMRNFVAVDSNNVYRDHSHGCECLSCIASNLPGSLIGTAPHASFWLIVTEDTTSENIIEEYNWASGAELADSVGADIISTSLLYNTFDHADQNQTYADMNGRTTPAAHAAIAAAERGILVLACEGNDAQDSWHYVATPADADSILAVGATDASGSWASFSSVGPSSDGRVKPDVADMGLSSAIVSPTGNYITYGSGTSFATPTLAGAAACFWQAHPDKTNMQIREAIIQSASQYTHPDTLEGYGIPNFEVANSIVTGRSVEKNNHDISVSVYPNPLNNSATISIIGDVSSDAFFVIYDLLGQRIKSISVGNKKNFSLDKDQFATGMYFFKLLTNQGETIATGKIVVE